jgi:Tat protein translocase TatB subunit
MFEVGFSELLLICVIALLVLGPQKLPKLAAQVGRWMGRARSMARQFREQLEEEAILEETKTTTTAANKVATPAIAGAAVGAVAGASADEASSTLTTGVPPDDDFAHHDAYHDHLSQDHSSIDASGGESPAATDYGDLHSQTARADEPAKG